MRLTRTLRALSVAMAVCLAFGPATSFAQDAAAVRKQEMQALGSTSGSAWTLYQALKAQAAAAGVNAKPADFSGVWTRAKGGLQFDPDLPQGALPTTARLTPVGDARVKAKVEQLKTTGGEYDPISDCRPPGVPRWFSEPFLKEFVVTRDQTWLMNEMVNDVRRIYTDGREHTPEADAYPLWNGDSIGFWAGDALVAHTSQLMKGQYQRGIQPDYSDKTELVERWHKVNDKLIEVDLWVFDPVNLAEPWYTHQLYAKLSNEDKSLRVRYWDCRENENNQILVKDDGTSQFKKFDFVKDNAAASKDPAVKAAQQPNAQQPK
jgi:hypothetical protein